MLQGMLLLQQLLDGGPWRKRDERHMSGKRLLGVRGEGQERNDVIPRTCKAIRMNSIGRRFSEQGPEAPQCPEPDFEAGEPVEVDEKFLRPAGEGKKTDPQMRLNFGSERTNAHPQTENLAAPEHSRGIIR